MENNLKNGDFVALKSGGPTMTVKHEMQNGTWECSWFDKAQVLQIGYFTPQQLNILKVD